MPTSLQRHGARYLQKPSLAVAEAEGAFLSPNPSDKTCDSGSGNPAPEVAIDSGVVVFSGAATVALRGLAVSDTFKGCTARGVAGGAAALRLELYSDLLLALKTGSAQEDDGAHVFFPLKYFLAQLGDHFFTGV